MPRISVVIPCYNHGRFVDSAVQSILGQTCKDVEIIIVDDGSTDPYTVQLLKDYSAPKTRVLHRDNGGSAAARNTGIEQASGEFIVNLDADDSFRPTFLEKAVEIFDSQEDVGIVGCWAQTYGDFDYIIRYKGGGARDSLCSMQCSATSIFRRECWLAIGGYDESLKYYDDWDFHLSILGRGWRIEVIPEILLDYCKKKGSLCDRIAHNRAENFRPIMQKHLELFREHVDQAVYDRDAELVRYLCLVESIYASSRYKIGGLFTVPFTLAGRALRRLTGQTVEKQAY